MKNWKPLLSALIFLGAQLVGGIIITLIFSTQLGGFADAGTAESAKVIEMSAVIITPEMLALTTAITGIFAVVLVMWILKSIHLKEAFTPRYMKSGSHIVWGLLAIIGAFSGIYSVGILSEIVQLPNLLEEEFLSMSQSFIGILCIGVIAPLVEELLLRIGDELPKAQEGGAPLLDAPHQELARADLFAEEGEGLAETRIGSRDRVG